MKAIEIALRELALLMPDYALSLETVLGLDWQDQIAFSLTNPIAHFTLSGNGNAVNAPVTTTEVRRDAPWTESAGFITYANATPVNSVEINAMVFYPHLTVDNQKQRVSPVLELLKGTEVVATSAKGYQRHITGHKDSSNTIVYKDPNPGPSPTYSLRTQQGSDKNQVVDMTGHISFTAVQ